MLSITDIHLDLNYKVGAPKKNCAEINCCQASMGIADFPEMAARQYGEYTCDLPLSTFEAMLEWLTINLEE